MDSFDISFDLPEENQVLSAGSVFFIFSKNCKILVRNPVCQIAAAIPCLYIVFSIIEGINTTAVIYCPSVKRYGYRQSGF